MQTTTPRPKVTVKEIAKFIVGLFLIGGVIFFFVYLYNRNNETKNGARPVLRVNDQLIIIPYTYEGITYLFVTNKESNSPPAIINYTSDSLRILEYNGYQAAMSGEDSSDHR